MSKRCRIYGNQYNLLTKMPFPLPLFSLQPATLFFTPKAFVFLSRSSITMSVQFDAINPSSQNALQTSQNYPVPLSPPLPPISKHIELARAMSASSKSSLFSLSRDDVVFEDQWLIVVNKPQGVYCESVLESVPQLLCDSAESGQLHFLLLGCFQSSGSACC